MANISIARIARTAPTAITAAALGVIWYAAAVTPHSATIPSVAIATEPVAAAEPETPLDVAHSVFAGFELRVVPENGQDFKKLFKFSYQSRYSEETARHIFLERTRNLVPLVFKKFPEADSIFIEACGDFVDIRGNKRNDVIFFVRIERDNSDTTNWSDVKPDNIMKFADTYLQDRSVTGKLGGPNGERYQVDGMACNR
jgi:hypothetical protein